MQALETLLSSQLAAWHNRHPLARHIRAHDVHTMGVVALPFMRSGPPREPQEPVLGEIGAPAAAPSFTQPAAPSLLQRLLAWRPGRKPPRDRWPVFSEQFVVGVSAAQAGEFARRHGYSQRPDDGSWPLRNIPVDESLASQGPADGAGAWPEEIYLLSAAIDAGPARTRVLVAQGAGLRLYITGPRCLHPLKVCAFGLFLALLLGVLLLASISPKKASAPASPSTAAAASSAASAPAPHAASVPASAAALAASEPVPPASAPSSAVVIAPEGSTPGGVQGAASAPPPSTIATPPASPGSAPTLMTASQLPDNMASAPDIRPRLMPRPEGAGRTKEGAKDGAKDVAKDDAKEGGKDAGKEGSKADGKAKRPTDEILERAHSSGLGNRAPPSKAAPSSPRNTPDGKDARTPVPATEPESAAETVKGRADKGQKTGQGGKEGATVPMVALVGPALPSKAEAEAYLQRMQPMIQPLVGKRPLELQVIQTPEGWRAAAWPFPSREEAQLINAMLVARGLRTRAVDF